MLIFTSIPFSAVYATGSQSPRLTVEAPETVATGDVFTVKIGIENNPGIVSLRFNVEYNTDKLKIVGYTDTKLIKKLVQKPLSKIDSPCIFYWTDGVGENNNYSNGTVLEVKFEAKSVASASEIKINFLGSVNSEIHKCVFESTSAKVDITSGNGHVSLEVPKSAVGGKTFNVSLNMDVNPGIASLKLKVLFDESVLKLVSCNSTDLLSGYISNPADEETSEHTVEWSVQNNVSSDKTGTIVGMEFIVLERSDTVKTEIKLEVIKAIDSVSNEKTFTTSSASIEAVSHIHNIEKTEAKAATHFEAGNIEYYTCTICKRIYENEKLTKEITADKTVIAAIPHEYKQMHDSLDHWDECSCGDKINIKAHSYGKWEIITSPDIATSGQKKHTCKDCGYTEYEEISPCLLGDMDGDNSVDAKDDILLQRYLADWNVYINLEAADVDSNGEVDGRDLIMLQRHLAQWIGYEKLGK